jgi:hypothetical protein
VSQLRKCVKLPTEIIDSQTIEIEPDLTYTEHPLKVLDTKERSTRRETIRKKKRPGKPNLIFSINFRISSKPTSEINHPNSSAPESRDEILFRGKGCDIQVIGKHGH